MLARLILDEEEVISDSRDEEDDMTDFFQLEFFSHNVCGASGPYLEEVVGLLRLSPTKALSKNLKLVCVQKGDGVNLLIKLSVSYRLRKSIVG